MDFNSKFLRHLYKEEFFKEQGISNNIEKVELNKSFELQKVRKIIIDIFYWLKNLENKCMYSYVDENSIYYDIINDKYFLYNYEDLSFKKYINSYGYNVSDTINNRVTLKSFIKRNYIFPCWGLKILYDISILFLDYGFYVCFDFYSSKLSFYDNIPDWNIEDMEDNLLISSIDLTKKNWQNDYINNGLKLAHEVETLNTNVSNSTNISNIISNDILKKDLDKLIHENSLEYNKEILYQVYEMFNNGKLIFEHKNNLKNLKNLNTSKDYINKKYFICTQSLTIDINQPIFKGYILTVDETNLDNFKDYINFDKDVIDNKDFFVLKFNTYTKNFDLVKNLCNYHYNNEYVININNTYYPNLVMSELIPVNNISATEIPKFINDLIPIIKKLHNSGYSHYDIKPDNIMKKYNSSTNCYDYVLIDYDSIIKNKLDFPRQSFTPLFSLWNNNYRDLFECTPFMDNIIHDLVELIHSLHFLIYNTLWSFDNNSDQRILYILKYLCSFKCTNIELDNSIYEHIIDTFNK